MNTRYKRRISRSIGQKSQGLSAFRGAIHNDVMPRFGYERPIAVVLISGECAVFETYRSPNNRLSNGNLGAGGGTRAGRLRQVKSFRHGRSPARSRSTARPKRVGSGGESTI